MSETSDTAVSLPTTNAISVTTTADLPADTGEQAPTVESLQAEIDKWKAQARKHEDRAKKGSTAEKELEQLRQQSMSDQERAVAQAVEAAKAEVRAEVATERAEELFRTLASDRIDDVDAVLTGLNLASFIDDEGRPNREAIAAFVDRLAPRSTETQTPTWPDLGQGQRGDLSHTPLNDDGLLRSLERAVGIRR